MAGSQENQRPRRRGRGQSQYNFSLPSDKKIVVLDPNISLAAQSIAASAATATVVEDAAKDSRDTNNAPVGPSTQACARRRGKGKSHYTFTLPADEAYAANGVDCNREI
jgi:hypothetical protein